MSVAVVGWGSVGDAAVQGIRPHHEVVGFDIDGRGDWREVMRTELALVCVNTDASDDSTLDMRNIFDVCADFSAGEYSGLVVIKST